MAKINPYELIGKEFTNANGDTYTVKEYVGKDSTLKHLYTIHLMTQTRTTRRKNKSVKS